MNPKTSKLLLLVLVAAVLVAVFLLLRQPDQKAPSIETGFDVGIMQHAENPILDEVRRGFLDALAAHGLEEGDQLRVFYKNAQTSNQTNNLIATQLVAAKVDLIFAIATPTAQAAAAATSSIPIIFGAISDPLSAGLVESLEEPGGNATGTSDVWPFADQFRLFKRILPSLKTLGVVHNPGEANSVYNMKLTRQAAAEVGLSLAEASVSGTAEVFRAASSLVGRCDALYIPSDNTAVTAAPAIIEVGLSNSLPVFSGEAGSVEAGAIATVGTNYYEIGRESGEMAHDVLVVGVSPASMPVRLARTADLIINRAAAEQFNVPVPDSVLGEAAKILD